MRHPDAERFGQPAHRARQQAEAFHIALFRAFVQQLHAQADAEQRYLQRAQRRDQALRVQALHRRRRGADARQDHPLRALQPGRIADQPRGDTQPLQGIADRSEVGPAGIDHRDIGNAHSAPLVDGSAVPSRLIAWRSARASALKLPSTL